MSHRHLARSRGAIRTIRRDNGCMPGMMMTVTVPGDPPTLADVSRLLGVAVAALDRTFGVVAIDPKAGLYTVLVDETVAGARAPGTSGPFANPRIEPMGPPTADGRARSTSSRRARRSDPA